MGNAHGHDNNHSRIRVETTFRRGEGRIQDMGKVYPRGTELNWTLYSARQGIPSLPANHVWKNTQNRRMVLVPNDQYLRASTVKMKRPNVNSPSEVTPNASQGRQRSNPTRSRVHGGHLGAMAAILAAIL